MILKFSQVKSRNTIAYRDSGHLSKCVDIAATTSRFGVQKIVPGNRQASYEDILGSDGGLVEWC